MMRPPRFRTAAGMILAVAVTLACATNTSSIGDDDEVTVSGVLTMPDGSPAADVTVGLFEAPGGVSAFFQIAATVATLGAACFSESVAICRDGDTIVTDSQGRYEFTKQGEDVKTMFGNPRRYLLTAELPPGDGQLAGPTVQTRFKINELEIDVPELAFWDPGLRVDAGRQWVRYAGAEHGDPELGYTVAVTDDDDQVVWSEPGGADGRLDARSIADTRGTFHISAAKQHRKDGVSFTTAYHTPHLPVHGVAGSPVSRNASCLAEGPDAAPVDRCGLTDGRYRDDFPRQRCPRESPSPTPAGTEPTAQACDTNSWVAVDLGARRAVGALFLHALRVDADTIVVETSHEGLRWTEHGTHEVQQAVTYGQLDLPAGTTARHVRLRTEDSSEFRRLAELSVWP